MFWGVLVDEVEKNCIGLVYDDVNVVMKQVVEKQEESVTYGWRELNPLS